MNKIIISLVLSLMFFLAACSMPETRVYSIFIPAGNKAAAPEQTDASITIQMLSERHLKQPYLVERNSPYQIEILKYSKWASSPNRMVVREIQEALSSSGLFREIGTAGVSLPGFYILKINLKQFERLNENQGSFASLLFDAELISPKGTKLYEGTISKKTAIGTADMAGLAKALSAALDEGIKEVISNIAGSLQANSNR